MHSLQYWVLGRGVDRRRQPTGEPAPQPPHEIQLGVRVKFHTVRTEEREKMFVVRRVYVRVEEKEREQ